MTKQILFYMTLLTVNFSSLSIASPDFAEEYEIPNQVLSNGEDWIDDISYQVGSTCASHAVSECLKYVHGNALVSPSYLHKVAHYHYGTKKQAYKHYSKGHSVEDLMNFARDYGVLEIPQGGENSGIPFPIGTPKYAFDLIYDVYKSADGSTKVEKIKNALLDYDLPIVISVISQEANGENLFDQWTDYLPFRFEKEVPSEASERLGHAVTVYGYSNLEDSFLVKNSWGTTWRSDGKGLLKYDYLEKHFNGGAFLGSGAKIIDSDYIRNRPFGYGRFEYGLGNTNTERFAQGALTGLGVITGGVVAAGALPVLSTAGVVATGLALGTGSFTATKTWFWDHMNPKNVFPVQ